MHVIPSPNEGFYFGLNSTLGVGCHSDYCWFVELHIFSIPTTTRASMLHLAYYLLSWPNVSRCCGKKATMVDFTTSPKVLLTINQYPGSEFYLPSHPFWCNSSLLPLVTQFLCHFLCHLHRFRFCP